MSLAWVELEWIGIQIQSCALGIDNRVTRPEADLRYVEHLCKRAKNINLTLLSQKIITFLLSYAVV